MDDDQRSQSPDQPEPARIPDRGDHEPNQMVEPAKAFEELSKLVLGEQSMTAVLQRVVELTKTVIPDIHEVSVTLMKDHQAAQTVVFTGALANQLDERQYEAGFGPCMDAALSGRTIAVSNADPESPYPEFSRISLRAGVSRSLSVALPVPQRIVGALNMYAAGDRAFDDDSVNLAETFASYAAVALANAQLYSTTANLTAQMQAAMQSRAMIEQAKGIIMGRNRCTSEEAFNLLTAMSQRSNVKLRILAQQVVDGVSRQD
jgi:GAF domain-containing protein